MLPEIASLGDRMAQGGDWLEARSEIARLHPLATTQDEFEALLHAHATLGLMIDEVFDSETAAKIRKIHRAEYQFLLSKESMEGGDLANPKMLDFITAREVSAGRMAPDDNYRSYANAAGNVLGDSAYVTSNPSRRGNWVFGVGTIISIALWFSSTRVFDFSPLWIAFLSLIGGWAINQHEIRQIKHDTALSRSRRGY